MSERGQIRDDQICQVYVDKTKERDENGDTQRQNYRIYPLNEGTGND